MSLEWLHGVRQLNGVTSLGEEYSSLLTPLKFPPAHVWSRRKLKVPNCPQECRRGCELGAGTCQELKPEGMESEQDLNQAQFAELTPDEGVV